MMLLLLLLLRCGLALVANRDGETCVGLRLTPTPQNFENSIRAYTVTDAVTRETIETGRFSEGFAVVCLEDRVYQIQLDAGCSNSNADSVALECLEPTPQPTTAMPSSLPTAAPSSIPTAMPSPAPSTATPSATPTATPTTAVPSSAPTIACTSLPTPRICWNSPLGSGPEVAIEPFDCTTHSNPIQVLRLADENADDGFESTYTVAELDTITGTYSILYPLDYYDGKVNAVAMLDGGSSSGYFTMGAFGLLLCRFDEVGRECFDEELFFDGPNVGAIVGTTYYYASNPGNDAGSSFYFVTQIHSNEPVFVRAALFVLNEDLYSGAVLDVAAASEDADDLVSDGASKHSYLFGLAEDARLLIVRMDLTSGYPEAYAVLPSVFDEGDAVTGTIFGAAFAYQQEGGHLGANYRVLFASNDGLGLYSLGLPIEVAEECWNTGTDTSTHVLCDSTASLTRLTPATETTSFNDGLNCPLNLESYIFETAVPSSVPTSLPTTPQPSLSPSFAPEVFWADERVAAFDCPSHPNELTLTSDYVLMEDSALFELDYYNGQLDGLAMYTVSRDESFLLGAFDDRLCRFDATLAVCFSGRLQGAPTAGASLDTNYYYLSDDSVYFVRGIDTDNAAFISGRRFAISPALITGVNDFAAIQEEAGVTLVDDLFEEAKYLIGFSGARLLLIRIGDDLYPQEYAVLETEQSHDVTSAFAFVDGNMGYRVFFASEQGILELAMRDPWLSAPAECWNTGTAIDEHVLCSEASNFVSTAVLTFHSESTTTGIDGANCLYSRVFPLVTHAPSLAPTCAGVCWADLAVDAFDCDAFPFPLQLLQVSQDDDFYSLLMLDKNTGQYSTVIDELDYYNGRINAAAMLQAADDFYMFAAFGSELCRFDSSRRLCFSESLVIEATNVGAIIGDNFYYARSPGSKDGASVHAVTAINTDSPVFSTRAEAEFGFSSSVYTGSVLDFAPLEDSDDDDHISDGRRFGKYLVGLGFNMELVVVRIDEETLLPESYAVLSSTISGGSAEELSGEGFGAAYNFDDSGRPSVLFASNGGDGVFELDLPLTIPNSCFNSGMNTETHVACTESTASLTYQSPAVATASNDGLNCPLLVAFEPSATPSAAPTRTPCGTFSYADAAEDRFVCWLLTDVSTFDCEMYAEPAQMMRTDDGLYEVARLLKTDFEILYELEYDAGEVNAVGLLDAGVDGFYTIGAFDGKLCRFDSESTMCFGEELQYSKPNVGAVVGPDYYYSSSPGKQARSVYVVKDVHSDEPEFDLTANFVISPALLDSAIVLDLAPLFETSDAATVVVDGLERAYLIGLASNFDVLVVRLKDRIPEAYAVLKSPLVDFGNSSFVPDGEEYVFGAAFSYVGSKQQSTLKPRAFFASNDGEAVFELVLPLFADDSCWNTGSEDHVPCDAGYRPVVRRVAPGGGIAEDNDGFSCPFHPADLFNECNKLICWSDLTVETFDCSSSPSPLQVSRTDSSVHYTVSELLAPNSNTTSFRDLYTLSYVDVAVSVNAVSLLERGDEAFFFGAFDSQLCRFDSSARICFDTALNIDSANVGAIIGTTFFYTKNTGRNDGDTFHSVQNIHTDFPYFVTEDALFTIDPALFVGAVLDVTGLEESSDNFVVDGSNTRYLLGMGGNWELLVVRIVDEIPTDYAVLESIVPDSALVNGEKPETSFGAAFTYANAEGTIARPLFASNEGFGVAELTLPFSVPARCWNNGAAGHSVCDLTVTLEVSPMATSMTSNDGANCKSLENFERAIAPTPAPTVGCAYPDGGGVCWQSNGVEPWDCQGGSEPVLMSTTPTTTTVEGYYSLDVSLTAVALLDGGSEGYFTFGALEDQLCRFDEEALLCFAERLQITPEAGAILGSTYYYSSNGEFYAVSSIETDKPVFFSEKILDISVTVRDLAVLPADDDFKGYLIGLTDDFELLFIMRVPDYAYALIATSVVDWRGATPVSTAAFGAAYAYSGDLTNDLNARAFFESSSGVFELALPLNVVPSDSECWNSGAVCDGGYVAGLTRVAESSVPDSSGYSTDGFNCPLYNGARLYTADCDATIVCWSEEAEQFDCSSRPWPVETASSGGFFLLDMEQDQRVQVASASFEDDVDATAMLTTEGGGSFLIGAVGDQLCRLEVSGGGRSCFEPLLEVAPDMGAIVGTTYYYASSTTGVIHHVTGVNTDYPTFLSSSSAFTVDSSLLTVFSSVFDIAGLAVSELIDDGTDAQYLLGLSSRAELFVVRLVEGAPQAYAALTSSLSFDGSFGAAFVYSSDDRARAFFASSGSDDGLYELTLPLRIGSACWNIGVTGHVTCDVTAELTLLAVLPSASPRLLGHHDGANCLSLTALETAMSTAQPTLSPTLSCASREKSVCWTNRVVQPMDCAANSRPLELRRSGEGSYLASLGVEYVEESLEVFYLRTSRSTVYSFDEELNGVAMLDGGTDGVYAMGALGDKLCRFDGGSTVLCFAENLNSAPTSAAIIGSTYYYLNGNVVDYVQMIKMDEPVFFSSGDFLTIPLVTNLAGLSEDVVQDGEEASYLFSLNSDFELLIVRITEDKPEAYAVLQATVDWNGEPGEFTAAFAFEGDLQGTRPRLLFSSQAGVFEVALPIAVAASCWNSGSTCDAGVGINVVRQQASTEDAGVDGLNCPIFNGLDLFEPPCPTVCWEEAVVQTLDCARYTTPLQVVALDGAFALQELAADNYLKVWEKSEVLPAGVAVLDGKNVQYLIGAFGDSLCRFDSVSKTCFEEGRTAPEYYKLSANATVGAVVGFTYYYAEKVSGGSFDYVQRVNTDTPNFSNEEDPLFTVDEGLFTGDILDLAGIVEEDQDDDWVLDGLSGAGYLFGLSADFELFVARIEEDEEPVTAYAVLDSVVNGLSEESEIVRPAVFGAAHSFTSADGSMKYVAFSTQEAGMMFRLTLPLTIPAECWNVGVFEHSKCSSSSLAQLTYDGDAASSGAVLGGMNCPSYEALFDLTLAPTMAPTLNCVDAKGACWANMAVEPFDCAEHSMPLQVMLSDEVYSVRELDTLVGDFALLYSADYTPLKVNGVALYNGNKDGFYAIAAIGEQLCRFDSQRSICFAELLVYDAVNVGTIIGSTYYYSKGPGKNEKAFYFVENIHTDTPLFVRDSILTIGSGLFRGQVLDVAGVTEGLAGVGSDDVVIDGYASSSYLVGLGEGFEVLLVRLDDDGYPAEYAVLLSTVDWDDDDYGGDPTVDIQFGAAFSYAGDWRGPSTRLLFAANGGQGLFELLLPLTVPEGCWNAGLDTTSHAACAIGVIANLVRRGPSAVASSNDGMNCAYYEGVELFTAKCSDACWDDVVETTPFDCSNNPGMLTVANDTLFEEQSSLYPASFHAIALLDGGAQGRFLFGVSDDDQLCRFDDETSVCFEGAVLSVTAAAIVGTTYYYASLGSIYYVEEIQTDYPRFHSAGLTVLPALYAGFLDFAPLTTVDGVSYLVSLGEDFEVLVVRLAEPMAYAVLYADVLEWSDDGNSAKGFGAAHTFYSESGDPYVVFSGGMGSFSLEMPLTVDPSCWNFGDNNEHAACGSPASLRYVGEAAESDGGTNCPSFEAFMRLTFAPTAAPTYACESDPGKRVCWSSTAVNPFDCNAHSKPIQVLLTGELYTVRELDLSGSWTLLYSVEGTSEKVNGVALLDGGDEYYVMAAVGSRLCRLDTEEQSVAPVCFAESLVYDSTNVGAILGLRYYYSDSPGGKNEKSFYYVDSINTDTPVFIRDADFVISTSLFTSSVLDVAALSSEQEIIVLLTSAASSGYLFGLASRYELLVVRLDSEGGRPAAYAVLPTTMSLSDDEDFAAEGEATGFGAFAYEGDASDKTDPRVFFASNAGYGVFDLGLPLTVADDCWNVGSSSDEHVLCSNVATLTRRADSEITVSNDGFNCPIFAGNELFSSEETCDGTVCWADMSIAQTDCATVLIGTTGAFELNLETGAVVDTDSIELFDAVGVFKDAYLVGVSEDKLCRFDSTGKICFSEERSNFANGLQVSPNAGCVLDTSFYYTKDLGGTEGSSIFVVNQIHTDYPEFVEAEPAFAVLPGLFTQGIRDITALPAGSGFTSSGEHDYLLGFSGSELLVVRLVDGLPDAYMVLPTTDEQGAGFVAFTYTDETARLEGRRSARVMFYGDGGLFELSSPLILPNECWNTGVSTSTRAHTSCSSSAKLTKVLLLEGEQAAQGYNCAFLDNFDDLYSTVEPTPAPSKAPTGTPECHDLKPYQACWAEPLVESLESILTEGADVQSPMGLVLKEAETLRLASLNRDETETIISFAEIDMGGVGVLQTTRGAFIIASIGGQLCRVDATQKSCFSNSLVYSAPNIGAVIGNSYYYAFRIGRNDKAFFAVHGINGDLPVFETVAQFHISPDLFVDEVEAVAAVEEQDDSKILDGQTGSYLLGLGAGFELLVVRLINGVPESYAVVGGAPSWGGFVPTQDEQRFGGAFAIGDQVLFAADSGDGIFELALPLTVDDSCWFNGFNTETHQRCAVGAEAILLRRADSYDATSSAGETTAVVGSLSNPQSAGADDLFAPTQGPTYAPTTATPSSLPSMLPTTTPTMTPTSTPTMLPSMAPTVPPCVDGCWADQSVEAWNCTQNPGMIQVSNEGALSEVAELNYQRSEDGSADEALVRSLFTVDYSVQRLSAIGMLDAGSYGMVPFGAFEQQLCRFDSQRARCFLRLGEVLTVAPNVGVIFGRDYFYALNIGVVEASFHVVRLINTDSPLFVEGAGDLLISPSLFDERPVLDVASVSASTMPIVDGATSASAYFFGLSSNFRLLVIRLKGDNINPEAYAVLPNLLFQNTDRPDDSSFGSAFAYSTPGLDDSRIFFASDDGAGVYELELPINVPEVCWNVGNVSALLCSQTSAVLVRRIDSTAVLVEKNDGMNCPYDPLLASHFLPTSQPTAIPTLAPTLGSRRLDEVINTTAPSFQPSRKPTPTPTLSFEERDCYRTFLVRAGSSCSLSAEAVQVSGALVFAGLRVRDCTASFYDEIVKRTLAPVLGVSVENIFDVECGTTSSRRLQEATSVTDRIVVFYTAEFAPGSYDLTDGNMTAALLDGDESALGAAMERHLSVAIASGAVGDALFDAMDDLDDDDMDLSVSCAAGGSKRDLDVQSACGTVTFAPSFSPTPNGTDTGGHNFWYRLRKLRWESLPFIILYCILISCLLACVCLVCCLTKRRSTYDEEEEEPMKVAPIGTAAKRHSTPPPPPYEEQKDHPPVSAPFDEEVDTMLKRFKRDMGQVTAVERGVLDQPPPPPSHHVFPPLPGALSPYYQDAPNTTPRYSEPLRGAMLVPASAVSQATRSLNSGRAPVLYLGDTTEDDESLLLDNNSHASLRYPNYPQNSQRNMGIPPPRSSSSSRDIRPPPPLNTSYYAQPDSSVGRRPSNSSNNTQRSRGNSEKHLHGRYQI